MNQDYERGVLGEIEDLAYECMKVYLDVVRSIQRGFGRAITEAASDEASAKRVATSLWTRLRG